MVFQVDKEGKRDSTQNSFFIQRVFHLLQFDYLLFVEDLQGMVGLARLVLNQHNTAKRPGTQRLQSIKVIKPCCVLCAYLHYIDMNTV